VRCIQLVPQTPAHTCRLKAVAAVSSWPASRTTLAIAQTNSFSQAYRMTVQVSCGRPQEASNVLSNSVCHDHRQDALSRNTAGMLE
jgi:hypothetical protein